MGGALSQAVSQSNTLNERLHQINQDSDTYPTSIPRNIAHQDSHQYQYGGSIGNIQSSFGNQF